MKLIITAIGFTLMHTLLYSQELKKSTAIKYDVVVSFSSVCCGPAKDDFLKRFLHGFNKKNGLSIRGYRIGGCGREGEFNILFLLPSLKQVKKQKFIKALNSVVSDQNDANKAAGKSMGNILLTYHVPREDISNCTGELVKWE